MIIIRHIFLLCIACYLAGCASGAKIDSMVYNLEQKQYPATFNNNVSLGEVSGGKETNPLWTSQIDNEAFSGAIIQSLQSQGLYAERGTYSLNAELIKVKQPLFSGNTTVATSVKYRLTDLSSNKVILDELIEAAYTAKLSEAFIGVQRLRLANEGSIKNNIAALLEKLATMDIDMKITLAESITIAN